MDLPSVHVTASPSMSHFTMAHDYLLVWHGRPQIIFLPSPHSTSHLHIPLTGLTLSIRPRVRKTQGACAGGRSSGVDCQEVLLEKTIYLAVMGANNSGDLSPS